MIKFFRRIRQQLLSENKFSRYLFYAIGETILVVIGILIALQINNWNEDRKNQREQYFILNKLQSDIQEDIENIKTRATSLQIDIDNYIICLEVLGHKRDLGLQEFRNKLSGILGITNFEQNATTFQNIVSSGKLELITNKSLSNALVNYYTESYKGWDTAMRDYTRNVIGPYFIQFDYIPYLSKTNLSYEMEYTERVQFYHVDMASFDITPKTLDDYRNNLFIINAISQKLYTSQGQLGAYGYLSEQMEQLVQQIEMEKKIRKP